MTPLEHAAAILKSLEVIAIGAGVTLPSPHLTGVAGAVISCAETRVSFALVGLVPNPQNAWACDVSRSGTYLVTIARECAFTSKPDGTEDYDKLAEISAVVDVDFELLAELFTTIMPGVPDDDGLAVGWGTERVGSITVESTGALIISTLTITVGIP